MTKWRKRILNILENSKRPLSAEEIYQLNEFKPSLSTIYRALNFLEKKDIVSSISFENTTRYFFPKEKHMHFLYCIKCGSIEVFENCIADEIKSALEKKYNYTILDHVFYFKGICKKCKKEGEK
ncbi:Fur family transcriptional regulator [Thermosipho melanesiensis]|uniref:Ferric uptake regulator, Fur family n=2 Tax=Thermosipho melanesiensis TaxID=46541 RepID=A6LK48_THEM4|nr:transcriptional repressor [Thermosipho melanesiensis]ABR30299.1 ferric uptake regulator, Fur family [Thermosipho melanesiensis BI429]APT73473.1 Fur family transcriptional regulator [Thermosipho melanesiensis]OOC37421.1 Fur family transcriptional regulator [Thermosipho melanesiensis]OOC39783.1 Fur family transcriptional regulator [Thermosipho melanesiensis]OOC39888.1 Fur family transcriptional regulator [Thermosipho melanesiensis]